MPIYTFVCEKCNKKEDRLVKYSEIDNQICDCDKESKMLKSDEPNRTSFMLKGKWFKNTGSY